MLPDESGGNPLEFEVDGDHAGERLDALVASRLSDVSRARISGAIDAGALRVNGEIVKRSYRVRPGDCVAGTLLTPLAEGPEAEDIPLDVLYEDEHIAVINKPADMVVHPSKGHWGGTLASALRFHFEELSAVSGPSRPGIVHRLDRDTTGAIITAKNDAAHQRLAQQFEQRSVKKEYLAIVNGCPDHDRDVISEPIGPHPNQRAKMAIRKEGRQSRTAETFYEVVQAYQKYTTVRLQPRTGRTHQIRVHLAHIQCPVLCDRLYSGAKEVTEASLTGLPDDGDGVVLNRQALHATQITLAHPESGEEMTFRAPLPADMERAIECLQRRFANGA